MTNQTDFPRTLQQAILYFSNPDNCLHFMTQLRWPNGVVCPRCDGSALSFLSTRRIWKCKACKRQFSVKVGTVMEDSPIGLDKWLCAIWMIANCKNGVSSYEVHRAIGITQKSAWFLLHRIRLAMQTGTFEKLSGTVEIDETWIGGKAQNMHKKVIAAKFGGKRPADIGPLGSKAIVMGMLERKGEVVTKVVVDTKRATLDPHIRENIEKGSTVYTDSHTAYSHLSDKNVGYVHDFINHVDEYVRGNVHTNSIENFWSLLKRTLKGTYVSVETDHLFRYLDEQSFRFNNRKTKDADRFIQVSGMVKGKRLTYAALTGKNESNEKVSDETE